MTSSKRRRKRVANVPLQLSAEAKLIRRNARSVERTSYIFRSGTFLGIEHRSPFAGKERQLFLMLRCGDRFSHGLFKFS